MSPESNLLRRFRHVAITEGISFLVLLFIAMPFKYGLGIEWPVKVVGWVHGLLFLLYCYYVARCWWTFRWSFLFAGLAFLASLLPFGPFVLDRHLPKDRFRKQTLTALTRQEPAPAKTSPPFRH